MVAVPSWFTARLRSEGLPGTTDEPHEATQATMPLSWHVPSQVWLRCHQRPYPTPWPQDAEHHAAHPEAPRPPMSVSRKPSTRDGVAISRKSSTAREERYVARRVSVGRRRVHLIVAHFHRVVHVSAAGDLHVHRPESVRPRSRTSTAATVEPPVVENDHVRITIICVYTYGCCPPVNS